VPNRRSKVLFSLSSDMLPIVRTKPPKPGSTTRAKLWQDISEKDQVIEEHPLIPIHSTVEAHSGQLKQLEDMTFTSETAMYKPLVDCLGPLFATCCTFAKELGPLIVSNTHKMSYLDQKQPDISICRSEHASPHTLFAFIEVKDKGPFGDAQYGQAYDYLLLMSRYQPARKYHVGMLTTISTSSILILKLVPAMVEIMCRRSI
jgi:hypothetical protein